MVIWVTGLSASGKTTLCKKFIKLYKKKITNLIFLDGDIVRDIFNNDLGFEKKDREKQISRIQSLSNFFEKQSFVVIVAALYSSKNILKRNRTIFKNYVEVYLKSTINFLQKREYKGLYKRALNKEIKNVVGVDIPWHEPKNAHITFRCRTWHSSNNLLKQSNTKKMSQIIYKKVCSKMNIK